MMKRCHSREWRSQIQLRSQSAFTLIELLIVVAIIAIFSAAMMAVITAPMFEHKRAIIEGSQQAGIATLLARLVEDAHTAQSVESIEQGIVFSGTANRGNVFYVTDKEHQLHRMEAAITATLESKSVNAAPILITGVQSFTAQPMAQTAGMYRITLECLLHSNRDPLPWRQDIDVAVGTGWAGGGAQ